MTGAIGGFGEVKFFDDFTGDTLDTNNWTGNADAGGTTAINEQENGVCRLANDGTDNDINSIFGAEIWQPNVMGSIIFEARVKINTSTAIDVFIGLTDDNDSDEMPLLRESAALTSTASDALGFTLDGATYLQWYVDSVKADADGTTEALNAKTKPVLDTWQVFRIVVESNGDAYFFIDGEEMHKIEEAITTTTQYCPCVAIQALGTAANVDVDYVYVKGGRS